MKLGVDLISIDCSTAALLHAPSGSLVTLSALSALRLRHKGIPDVAISLSLSLSLSLLMLASPRPAPPGTTERA